MQSSKALYSTCFEDYKLSEMQIKELQDELLMMFLDFKKVCDENNIDYMLSEGTLLGAIRHKGFIPWDDDIDIMMLRSEYEKFRKVFLNKCSEKYVLAEPLSDEKYFCKMPKIYKKGTVYVEIPNAGIDAFNMLFLDIFIIENIPNAKIIRKFKEFIYDFAYKGASVCVDYMYPSPVIEEEMQKNAELKKYYEFRRRLGRLFAYVGGEKFWLKVCEKMVVGKKKTNYLGVPSAISYGREIFPKEVLTEWTIGNFCGYEVKIPVHYEEYLTNLYGDYMQIPPVDKRETHVAYKIKL